MKLLLSNDDGYDAPGITTLAKVLSSQHEVIICAPLRQMSATGHAINVYKALEIKRVRPGVIALDGTPADCVKSAVSGLFPDSTFDAVISGINDGPNLGEDIFYSGTVAAAREASLNGLFSLACSRDGWDLGINYDNPARFILNFLNNIPKKQLATNSILNINFPRSGTWNSIELCSLGSRIYQDRVSIFNRKNKEFLKIEGDPPSFNSQPGSDMDAIQAGNISITALANSSHDPVTHKLLQDIIIALD